jgi:hypothetical protein
MILDAACLLFCKEIEISVKQVRGLTKRAGNRGRNVIKFSLGQGAHRMHLAKNLAELSRAYRRTMEAPDASPDNKRHAEAHSAKAVQ